MSLAAAGEMFALSCLMEQPCVPSCPQLCVAMTLSSVLARILTMAATLVTGVIQKVHVHPPLVQ